VVLADPCGNGIVIADLPVQALLRLVHCSGDVWVAGCDDAANFVHVSRLIPWLGDIGSILVSEDPIELVTITKGALD
jgi:hypothetical protein